MAKIVFGVATSHSPQLSTPVEDMHLHVERDKSKEKLFYKGKKHTHAELYELRKGEGLAKQVSEEKWTENYNQWEKRIAEVRDALDRVDPDILLVVGDDQRELFLDDGMPVFAVFWGQNMEVFPKEKLLPSLERSRWANFGEKHELIPAHPELGKHVIECMMAEGFDVAHLTEQPQKRSIGHSFIFTRKRLMTRDIPIVPVMINTYFPPNQPTVSRCYNLARHCAGR